MAPAVFQRKVPNKAYKKRPTVSGRFKKTKSFESFRTRVVIHNNHTSEKWLTWNVKNIHSKFASSPLASNSCEPVNQPLSFQGARFQGGRFVFFAKLPTHAPTFFKWINWSSMVRLHAVIRFKAPPELWGIQTERDTHSTIIGPTLVAMIKHDFALTTSKMGVVGFVNHYLSGWSVSCSI